LEFEWAGTMPPYSRVLDEMAATGYAGTELGRWGFMPTEPAALRDELARRALALLGAFVPVRLTVEEDHRGGSDAAVRVAKLLAATVGDAGLVVLADDTARDPVRTALAGRITADQTLDEADWRIVTDGAHRIARDVKDATGLRTVFHHHCATFVETPWEIDALLSRTDPSLLGLCLDTGHCTFGGGDPLDVMEQWGDRVWHVHLKDCDPRIHEESAREGWDYAESVRRGVFCELGKGQVDFRGVLDRLQALHFSGWLVVEQDVLPSMGTPAESAARNRRYLQSLGV
jgi:inosose dehydratase